MRRLLLFVTFVLLLPALIGTTAARISWTAQSANSSAQLYPGFWHTDGTRIVDQNGQTVRIAGVTWYGMESAYWVPAGLDYQPYTRIMDEVKALGFNTIRLPFSNELVETNPVVTQMVAANPQFKGMHALDVMDAIVSYAQKIGLKIILDDHRSVAATRKRVNYLDEGLWYSDKYPESSWIADWKFIAQRYLHNDAVIGFDLRNEPHTNPPGPWTVNAYVNQGATWGPTNGVDSPATDWRLAAERAANAILAINPHLLMIVEGIQIYPDPSAPDGTFQYWWGSILSPARFYPVVLNVPHQLVYSAHDWGPWKYNYSWFRHMTYDSMLALWHRNWSFLMDDPKAPYAAPVWLGEFGTCTNWTGCVDRQEQGNQAQWFHFLLRYLHEHPDVGWSFFALNGRNSNDHVANNGILNANWDAPRNDALMADLKTIQP